MHVMSHISPKSSHLSRFIFDIARPKIESFVEKNVATNLDREHYSSYKCSAVVATGTLGTGRKPVEYGHITEDLTCVVVLTSHAAKGVERGTGCSARCMSASLDNLVY